jgi:hypothetical protein
MKRAQINYTSPIQIQTGAKLDVNGNVAMTGFLMPTAANPGYVLTSDAAGNGTWQIANPPSPFTKTGTKIFATNLPDSVGIGTATPASKLHVYGSADPLQITLQNTGGNFKTGFNIKTALNEWFIGQEQTSASGFRITDIDAGFVRFQIDQAGMVGIGLTTPGALLEIGDTGPNWTTSNYKKALKINTASAIELGGGGGVKYGLTGDGSVFKLFHTTAEDNSAAQAVDVTINNSGNVGIGIPPSYKLDVNGITNVVGFRMAPSAANAKVMTSDATGVGTWQYPTTYTVFPVAPVSTASATAVNANIANVGTFTKLNSASVIELAFTGHVSVASFGAASGVVFELRVDGNFTSFGNAQTVVWSADVNRPVNVTILGTFKNLTPGTHTVSLWASAPGGVTTTIFVNSGNWSDQITVKEVLGN